MRRWNRFLRPLVGSALLLLPLDAAPAEDDAEARGAAAEDRLIDWNLWTPSFTIGFGFYSHGSITNFDGCFNTTTNSNLSDIPANRQGCNARLEFSGGSPNFKVRELRLRANEANAVDGAVIPVSIELQAPALEPLLGKPRPLFHAGYAFSRQDPLLLAREKLPRLTAGSFPITGIRLRSGARAKLDHYWFMGVGAAFTVPAGPYEMTFKPSINYMRQKYRWSAFIEDVATSGPTTGQSRTSFFDTDQFYSGVGPGLGIDFALGRRGPIAIGVYMQSQVAFFFGQRQLAFTSEDFQSNGQPLATGGRPGQGCDPNPMRPVFKLGDGPCPVEYKMKLDSFNVTASAGIRFSWVGR